MTAWIRASSPPATAASSTPACQDPSLSAPRIPKKQPMRSMPSSPMFTTPLRSENMPPTAAKISGVAYRSIEAVRAPHTNTASRFATLEIVAATPSAPSASASTIAVIPRRRRPLHAVHAPSASAAAAIAIGTAACRADTGGTAIQNATIARAIPAMPVA